MYVVVKDWEARVVQGGTNMVETKEREKDNIIMRLLAASSDSLGHAQAASGPSHPLYHSPTLEQLLSLLFFTSFHFPPEEFSPLSDKNLRGNSTPFRNLRCSIPRGKISRR